MVGARCMCQVMFNGNEFDLLGVNTDFLEHGEHVALVAVKTAVAIQEGHEGAVGCVGMPPRVMPARGAEDTDRRKRIGDNLNIRRFDLGLLQAVQRRLFRLLTLGVFVAQEAFLFRSGDDVAIDDKCRRRIMSHRATQPKYDHRSLSPIFAIFFARGSLIILFCGRNGDFSGTVNHDDCSAGIKARFQNAAEVVSTSTPSGQYKAKQGWQSPERAAAYRLSREPSRFTRYDREEKIIQGWLADLPAQASVLDAPCGTGRL